MIRLRAIPVEILFTVAMIAIMVIFSFAFQLPISIPSGNWATILGIHYLYPLIGVAVWGIFAALGKRRNVASLTQTFLIALPCYTLVLVTHFNIKLWMPHINPLRFDEFFWQTDQWIRPVVDLCIWLRQQSTLIIPADSNLYIVGFITLFYVSFCYHAYRTPQVFRTLFLAVLIFQGLGALAYLPFPALGPFIYENGTDSASTTAQAFMLATYNGSMEGGSDWIARYGGSHLTTGLAAMPSLHSGGALLFLLFARRHAKLLVPLYTFMLGFILIAAVATRWHYVIDLPVGLALGWLSLKAADWVIAWQPNPYNASAPSAKGSFPALAKSGEVS
jgi:PAP2 superfamily